MSRTYREMWVGVCSTCLKPTHHKTLEFNNDICTCYEEQDHYGTRAVHYKIMKVRDFKPWYKPPKDFKKMRRQQFRAQSKEALHNRVYKGKDFIPPVNKRSDVWNWV